MNTIIIGTILFGAYLLISILFSKKKTIQKNEKNRYDDVFDELERCKKELNDEAEQKTRMGS